MDSYWVIAQIYHKIKKVHGLNSQEIKYEVWRPLFPDSIVLITLLG